MHKIVPSSKIEFLITFVLHSNIQKRKENIENGNFGWSLDEEVTTSMSVCVSVGSVSFGAFKAFETRYFEGILGEL